MKKFRFKLDALEKKRKHIEKEKQADLAKVSALYNREEALKELCLDSIKKNIRYIDSLDYKDENAMNILVQADMHSEALRMKANNHKKEMDKIRVELVRRQKILLDASKDRRAVEILREHKYKAYMKEFRKHQQSVLDNFRNKNDAMNINNTI